MTIITKDSQEFKTVVKNLLSSDSSDEQAINQAAAALKKAAF